MAGRGGFRETAGRKAAYPGKDLAAPFYMQFTPEGRAAMDVLQARSGLSRNDILAHLVKKHGPKLDGKTHYVGKSRAHVWTIRLPPAQGRTLRAARKRTDASYSDLGEDLVVAYGLGEASWPLLPGADKRPRRKRRRRG